MITIRRYCGRILYQIDGNKIREYCGSVLYEVNGNPSKQEWMAIMMVLFGDK